MKNQLIKLTIDYFGGEDTIYLPLQENLDEESLETFEELKAKWEGKKWGYHGNAFVELVDNHPENLNLDFNETTKCSKFDIWCFTSEMIDPELYSRPFDKNPDGDLYSCHFAVDCVKGDVYSKDFAYFECEECNRTICQQNPSNGWHIQYRHTDGGMICLQCYEKDQFENGVDIDEIIKGQRLDGMFFNDSELKENGFVKLENLDGRSIGMGRVSTHSVSGFFYDLQAEKDKGTFDDKIVIISYEDMAIGGLGGSVSIWVKTKSK